MDNKSNQEKVREFMEAVGQDIPERAYTNIPAKLAHFRNSLIKDEVNELEETGLTDVENIARELCDILYVTYGTALAYGLDLQPVFDIVHKANMEKISGPIREDGKRMKPEGWKFPAWELFMAVSHQQGAGWYTDEQE